MLSVVILPGLVFGLWYVLATYREINAVGFPLDDSWIHAQFARNLALGRGFTYTGSDWVAGSTAPAWTVLLAVGFFVLRHMVTAAFVIGLTCQALTGFYAYRMASMLGGSWLVSALAGALTVVTPVMVWGSVSAMEVPLAALLVMAGLYHVLRPGKEAVPLRGFSLLGAATLARPESLAIAVVAVAFELTRGTSVADGMLRAVKAAAVVGACFSALLIFSWLTIGRPLPTTFYAKSGPGIVRAIDTRDSALATRALQQHGPQAVRNFWRILEDQYGVAAWIAPLALLMMLAARDHRRAGSMLLVVLLVVPFLMGITAPQRLKPDNVRYAAQLVAPVAVLIAIGLSLLLRHRTLAGVACAAAVLVTSTRAVAARDIYTASVRNINELHVKAGQWMHDAVSAGSTIAVNDVGAIAFFSGHKILDLEGLVSPEVLPYRSLPERGLRVVLDRQPQYIAIFPHWYPDIAGRTDLFQEVHRVGISGNVISAGDTLVIYKTPWSH